MIRNPNDIQDGAKKIRMLIAGYPGIGKSTLLLQVCANLCAQGKRVLYVSGEESAKQVKLRARRLKIDVPNLYVLAENAMDNVEERMKAFGFQTITVEDGTNLDAIGLAIEAAKAGTERSVLHHH